MTRTPWSAGPPAPRLVATEGSHGSTRDEQWLPGKVRSGRIREERERSGDMTPTPRMACLTVVGTLVYLGLAVLGWGGLAAFFAHPARRPGR
jgi:hypothetical protein